MFTGQPAPSEFARLTHAANLDFYRLSVEGGLTLKRAFAVVFAISVFLSLVQIYVLRPVFNLPQPLGYDGHVELAQSLVAGRGYVFHEGGHKVFHRPPAYAALLVPGMLLPQPLHGLYVAALNGALLAGTGAMLLAFGRRYLGQQHAAVAWICFSFHPVLLYTAKTAIPSLLQTFLYFTLFFSTVELLRRRQDARGSAPAFEGFGFGFLLLGGTFSHGTMLAHSVLALAILFTVAIWKKRGGLLRISIYASATLLLCLAPWTWRNYKVTGAFIPVVGNSGLAYFSGNAHWGIGAPAWQANEKRHEAELRHIGFDPRQADQWIAFYGFTDVRAELEANKRAKAHLAAHPAAFVGKLFLNAAEYYFPVIYYIFPPEGSLPDQHPFPTRLLHMDEKSLIAISFLNAAVILCAMVGVRRLFAQPQTRPVASFLLLGWIAFAIPYFPFLTAVNHTLYTFGTYPFLFLLASTAFSRAANSRHKHPVS